jgi:heme/copper-type cytochrome/quinol oxidase subunit 3
MIIFLKFSDLRVSSYNLLLRTSEIHLFYNLQVFYWHFIEILWLFIFLLLYLWSDQVLTVNNK